MVAIIRNAIDRLIFFITMSVFLWLINYVPSKVGYFVLSFRCLRILSLLIDKNQFGIYSWIQISAQ